MCLVFNLLEYRFKRKTQRFLKVFKSTNNSKREMVNVSFLFVVFSVVIAETEASLIT